MENHKKKNSDYFFSQKFYFFSLKILSFLMRNSDFFSLRNGFLLLTQNLKKKPLLALMFFHTCMVVQFSWSIFMQKWEIYGETFLFII